MNRYCTTVAVYLHAISALPEGNVCDGFTQMALKVDKPTSTCTLHEVRQLKETTANKAPVHSYRVFIQGLAKGSVLVQLCVHPDCSQMVFNAIT